jgi:DNA repair exonuclease SbcCD ATPase subunit
MSPASVLGQLRDAIRDGKDKIEKEKQKQAEIEKEKQKQAEIEKEKQKQAANDLNNGFSRFDSASPVAQGGFGSFNSGLRVAQGALGSSGDNTFRHRLMYCLDIFPTPQRPGRWGVVNPGESAFRGSVSIPIPGRFPQEPPQGQNSKINQNKQALKREEEQAKGRERALQQALERAQKSAQKKATQQKKDLDQAQQKAEERKREQEIDLEREKKRAQEEERVLEEEALKLQRQIDEDKVNAANELREYKARQEEIANQNREAKEQKRLRVRKEAQDESDRQIREHDGRIALKRANEAERVREGRENRDRIIEELRAQQADQRYHEKAAQKKLKLQKGTERQRALDNQAKDLSGHRRRIFEHDGIWHYEAFRITTGSEQTIDVPEAYRVRDSCEPADVEGLTETHI